MSDERNEKARLDMENSAAGPSQIQHAVAAPERRMDSNFGNKNDGNEVENPNNNQKRKSVNINLWDFKYVPPKKMKPIDEYFKVKKKH